MEARKYRSRHERVPVTYLLPFIITSIWKGTERERVRVRAKRMRSKFKGGGRGVRIYF